MAALTVGIIISDMWFLRGERVITHLFLGGIITGLFYVLCQHGYELINVIFLIILPVYLMASLTTTAVRSQIHSSHEIDEHHDEYMPCGDCGAPPRSCSCVKPKPVPPPPCETSPVTNACVGASVNTEDPTPMTRRWYSNQRNM